MKILNGLQKKISIKILSAYFLLIIFALAPGIAFGADKWGLPGRPEGIPDKDLSGLLLQIINWVLGFVILFAVLMLIWGGVRYITAIGDNSKEEEAKNIITEAVIGLTIVGVAYAIVSAIVKVWIGGDFT